MTNLTDEVLNSHPPLEDSVLLPPAYAGQTELSADHFWLGDIPPDPIELPSVWTRDRAPDGLHKGQYQGGQLHAETGEVTGGTWIDTHAPTEEEQAAAAQVALAAVFEQAIQEHLDAAARTRGYDSIATAVSYAEEPAVPKFQEDGKAFRAWRSLVWAHVYQELAKVKAGEREIPTLDALMVELPALSGQAAA